MIEGDEKYIVQESMQKYGGSFITNLGQALACADMVNTQKIKNTWSEEWDRYFNMGKKEFNGDLR